MTSLSPREIVSELDRFIIGQDEAKKAVAIALRNRWRRQQVQEPLRDEIIPKNILMIGPTGCGKTEIARRLAKLADAPFIKIEATKFTEVGYVGRDVDSIIRDMVEISLSMTREKRRKEVKAKAELATEERLLDALVGKNSGEETRAKYREKLRNGDIEDTELDIDIKEAPQNPFQTIDIPDMPGAQMGMMNLGDMLGGAFGDKSATKRLTVKQARDIVEAEEADKLIDNESITYEAIERVENHGIVFLDEVDKITARSEAKGGDVSREGVQRDLLPLIEGTTVNTKHGPVKTDHILFIASGAFHLAKPSDMLPELQGRLPIRVELKALTTEDMVRILSETEACLLTQYEALIGTEEVTLTFKKDAVQCLADLATRFNREVENIGARRLHTLMEKLLEEISYSATDRAGEKINIDKKYVEERLADLSADTDLSKFIL